MRTLTLLLLSATTLALAAHAAPAPRPLPAKGSVVVMKTSLGTIKVELSPDKAPVTVKNFLKYVDDKFYDGTNVANNTQLDHRGSEPHEAGYCVFGKVIEGMDVVDKIKAVKTRTLFPGFADVPVKDVVIESVRRAAR
jgi:cyclophilin family peptidyl-prolyl cis-trans isomerase